MFSRPREALIRRLTLLGTGEYIPCETNMGICNELRILGSEGLISGTDLYDTIDLMYEWPEAAHYDDGCRCSPVGHPDYDSTEEAYWVTKNKWGDDEYGDARRRLCLWLAEELGK